MVDPTQKQSDANRPIRPEPEKREEIDPEKFKKVLKVDESSEADKRRKRRMKMEEEEEGAQEVSSLASPADPTAFSELMKGGNQKTSVFDPHSPGIQKRFDEGGGVTKEESTFSQNSFEEGPASDAGNAFPSAFPSAPPNNQEQFSEQRESLSGDPYFPSPSSPPNENLPNASNGPKPSPTPNLTNQMQHQPSQDTSNRHHTSSPTKEKAVHAHKKQKKRLEKDTSLFASQPPKKALKAKKKSVSQAPTIVKTARPNESTKRKKGSDHVRDASHHKTGKNRAAPPNKSLSLRKKEMSYAAAKEKKGVEQTHTFPPSKQMKPPSFTGISKKTKPLHTSRPGVKSSPSLDKPSPLSHGDLTKKGRPHDPKHAIALEDSEHTDAYQASISTHVENKQTGKEDKEKKGEFPFINAQGLISTLPASDPPLAPIAPPSDSPAYLHLSSDTYQLFEKMVGAIIIQDHSGIKSTTITLSLPHSVFDKAEITFDKYQTAPNSYNLQLKGSPEAVALFTSNIDDLAAAFKQGQHAFEVNILRPALTSKKSLIRRKSSAGQGGSQDKR